MSEFTGPLAIKEDQIDSEQWMLLEDLNYEVGVEGSGQFITIPVAFVSDGASIPWPFSIVFPHWAPRYRRPSVLHDLLRRSINEGHPHFFAPTRRIADLLFLEAMAVCHVSWLVRHLFWLVVRVYTVLTYGRNS